MEKIITNICAIYYGITMLIGLLVCIIDSIFLLTINKRFFYFVNIDFFLINLLLCPSIMLILLDDDGCEKFQILDCSEGCGFDISVQLADCIVNISVTETTCTFETIITS